MTKYTAALANEIEARWQQHWAEHHTYRTPNPTGPLADPDHPRAGAPKRFVMAMFPYLSADGLHVGHPLGYVAADCYARYLRMSGFNVLHPMGFDAFGLPAEQYAMSTGVPPQKTTEVNVRRYRDQLRRLGLGYDDRRFLATTDPGYYRWTQWIFLQIFNSWYDPVEDRARPVADLVAQFETGVRATPGDRPWAELSDVERRGIVDGHRLAYLADAPVNWCPELGTVLADEEVTEDGRSERGNFPVERRQLRQWVMRITAYAHRLVDDLEPLEWPEHIKAQQRHWVGRPEFRDWLFSRQRYWGEPFPIVYDEHDVPIALPESMLPVELPVLDAVAAPTADVAPLARATDWVHVELDLGDGPKRYRRETNTMPQWAGSCWYYLRYTDPSGTGLTTDESHWMPVDLYIGGVEHTVMHLLYARFWHKVLFDLGHVSTAEPFQRLCNNGYVQAYAYTDARGFPVDASTVVERDGRYFAGPDGDEVTRTMGKMGKSLKNGIAPDDVCARYGADTLRLYEMSMGPLETSRPWDTHAIAGSHRLLQKIWRLAVDETTGQSRVVDGPAGEADRRLLHRTIDGVRADMEALRFNVAIAKITSLVNAATTRVHEAPVREIMEPLVLMAAPFAPHLAEELWHRMGHSSSVVYAPYPVADPALVADESVTYAVQVNGRVRARISLAPDATTDAVRDAALAAVAVEQPRDVIVVPGRLVNVVL